MEDNLNFLLVHKNVPETIMQYDLFLKLKNEEELQWSSMFGSENEIYLW